MSIKTQIDRLAKDKRDIQAALVSKGVIQAADHSYDDFAADIRSITSGDVPSNYGKVTNNTSYLLIE